MRGMILAAALLLIPASAAWALPPLRLGIGISGQTPTPHVFQSPVNLGMTTPIVCDMTGAADTAEERAQIALDELKRVGAFERSVLIVITPTGSGWVEDGPHVRLEKLRAQLDRLGAPK